MKRKYWEVLLIEWRKIGRKGFAIPYIIGSQKYLYNTLEKQGISDLIWDIAKSDNINVYITYCTDINDLILGVKDKTVERLAGNFIKFNNGTDSSLYITKIAYNLGETIEEIIESLIEKYQNYIDNEKFSINDEERGEFTLYERNFILDCFTNKLSK